MAALIKFTQGPNTDIAGRAVRGTLVDGAVVCTTSTGAPFKWVLSDVPAGSALTEGVLNASAVSATFTPDVTGTYQVRIFTGDQLIDYRDFSVPVGAGSYDVPAFSSDEASFNFGGSTKGWKDVSRLLKTAATAGGGGIPAPGGPVKGDILFYDGAAWTRLPAGVAGEVLQTAGVGFDPLWAADGGIPAPGGPIHGDLLYYSGTDWVRLPAGTSGQFLKTLGVANPAWAAAITPPAGSAQGDILYRNATDWVRLAAVAPIGGFSRFLKTLGPGSNPTWEFADTFNLVVLPYGPNIATSPSTASTFVIEPNDGAAFTIDPTSTVVPFGGNPGKEITYIIRSNFGGVLGACTFDPTSPFGFELSAPFINPASAGKSRSITFVFSGPSVAGTSNVWIEKCRSVADAPF